MATLSAPSARRAPRARCPSLADEIVAAIAARGPRLRAADGGPLRRDRALRRRRSRSTASSTCWPATHARSRSARDTYQRLGAGEYRQGRTLDALLAAYRVGARVAWRRFVDAGTQAGFPRRRALRPRRGDVRLHRRDLRRVRGGLRRGAVRGRGRDPAPPPAAAAAARAGARRRRRGRPDRRPGRGLGAAAAASPRSSPAEADQPEGLAAAHGEAGPSEELADGIAARLARRLGPGAVGAAVGGLAVVMMPDPDGPGPAQGARGRAARRARRARARR